MARSSLPVAAAVAAVALLVAAALPAAEAVPAPTLPGKGSPMCCMAQTAACMACAKGVTVSEFCDLKPDTTGCKPGKPELPVCCEALTAACMACAEGMTEAEFCDLKPDTGGCKPVKPESPMCCKALTAACMACAEGVTEAEFCDENPDTVGCKPGPFPTSRNPCDPRADKEPRTRYAEFCGGSITLIEEECTCEATVDTTGRGGGGSRWSWQCVAHMPIKPNCTLKLEPEPPQCEGFGKKNKCNQEEQCEWRVQQPAKKCVGRGKPNQAVKAMCGALSSGRSCKNNRKFCKWKKPKKARFCAQL